MTTDRTNEIKHVLITGANGSAGRYLCEYLRDHHPDVQVFGTARNKNSVTNPPVECRLHEMELTDLSSILRVITATEPDVIFHLAANPDKCFETPVGVLQSNTIGTANLFEAVRFWRAESEYDGRYEYDPIIVSASSSECYGDVRPEDVPIKESCPFRPVSPYAVSKAAQDHLATVYFKAYGMRIITTRAFTYNNFYRTNLFTSDFARQIALIEAGKLDVLKHGNLDSVRVICDARDIACAYWLAATRCRFGEAYNIGGDCQVSVGEVLAKLCALSNWKLDHRGTFESRIKCEPDPALMRPTDVTLQVPDSTKFREATGWTPQFDLTRSLRDLLNYWRKEVVKV
jgi:GDP-mannose 4,6-dehydratase